MSTAWPLFTVTAYFIQTGGPGVAPPCTDCEAASVVVAADQTLHAQGGACERFATDTDSSRDLVGSTASSWSDGSPWFSRCQASWVDILGTAT